MEEALRFFRTFEIWIYVILGLGGLFYLRRFILSWDELRGAAFGLERENAQARLNQSASMLVLILILVVSVFTLVTFIAPSVPGATPLLTPTLDLLATSTTTLVPELTETVEQEPVESPSPTESTEENVCIPGQIIISFPEEGGEAKGIVEVVGTANTPNFGFYKLEMKRPDESIWATIQAGNEVRVDEKLGDWDTRRLTPGEYQLGLVVVDNEARASAPCFVRVRVVPAPEETPNP